MYRSSIRRFHSVGILWISTYKTNTPTLRVHGRKVIIRLSNKRRNVVFNQPRFYSIPEYDPVIKILGLYRLGHKTLKAERHDRYVIGSLEDRMNNFTRALKCSSEASSWSRSAVR